jgi:hypothetical protein
MRTLAARPLPLVVQATLRDAGATLLVALPTTISGDAPVERLAARRAAR